MRGIGKAFRELGDLFEVIENGDYKKSRYDITNIYNGGEEEYNQIGVTVAIEFPFLPSQPNDSARLTPTKTRITESGALQVEFQAIVGQQTNNEQSSDSQSVELVNSDDKLVNSDDELAASQKNCDSDDIEISRPSYRDPDRLAEVYEAYETFEEMTEALNVDVTSQTVRRYMIQHGIHEPASRSGPTSAKSLLEMDPDSIPLEKSGSDDEAQSSPTDISSIDNEGEQEGENNEEIKKDGDTDEETTSLDPSADIADSIGTPSHLSTKTPEE